MKKAFALVMAIAMVASMAAVSFAAVTFEAVVETPAADVNALAGVNADLYKYSTTNGAYSLTRLFGTIPYGTVAYVVLEDGESGGIPAKLATADKTASGLKLDADWDEGEEAIKSVELVKKKVKTINSHSGNVYNFAPVNVWMLAIATQAVEGELTVEVAGDITLKGKTGTGEKKESIEVEVGVAFTAGYNTPANMAKVADDGKVYAYDFDDAAYDDDADEYEMEFGSDAVVTADVRNEKLVVLSFDSDYIEEVDEAYPDANIDFYALTGSFKKTAKVVVSLAEDEFLYAVVDGEVVEVNGEYDDWAEEFTFKAKKLGTYIISDVELNVADVVVANPSTGAAA